MGAVWYNLGTLYESCKQPPDAKDAYQVPHSCPESLYYAAFRGPLPPQGMPKSPPFARCMFVAPFTSLKPRERQEEGDACL